MKENVLDVLMYLFENCIEEEIDGDGDREALEDMLIDAGFPPREIDKAFSWLEGLAAEGETARPHASRATRSIRVYAAPETERLDARCRGFLLFLEQAGVLPPEMRELVIDRVMELESGEITLDQLKWILLMVLFNQPGQEEACSLIEELVFEGPHESLH